MNIDTRGWTSHDANGPVIPCGLLKCSGYMGPPIGHHEFDAEIFLACSEESELILEFNDLELFKGYERNDYYGFGCSALSTLADSGPMREKLVGLNADLKVVTKITKTPCLLSQEEPFYNGSQKVHHIPLNWRVELPEGIAKTEEFVVWKNGSPTEEAVACFQALDALQKADGALNRKGSLRFMARGQEASAERYLQISA